jgi:hypothetical protein
MGCAYITDADISPPCCTSREVRSERGISCSSHRTIVRRCVTHQAHVSDISIGKRRGVARRSERQPRRSDPKHGKGRDSNLWRARARARRVAALHARCNGRRGRRLGRKRKIYEERKRTRTGGVSTCTWLMTPSRRVGPRRLPIVRFSLPGSLP